MENMENEIVEEVLEGEIESTEIMEKYYKNINDGYIIGIGIGLGDEQITEEEYENILSIIRNRPEPEAGYSYKLRVDLTWNLVEVPVEPVDDEIDAEEALNIILGGEV